MRIVEPRAGAIRHYGVALVAVAIAFAATYASWPLLQPTPWALFFAAVLAGAWSGGLRPGLLATIVAAALGQHFFLEPYGATTLKPTALIPIATFVTVSLFICLLASARRRAVAFERAERRRFQATMTSIGDAVIATDDAGRVTFVNGVATALTGWTPADAAGRPLTDVFRIVNERTRLPVENPALRALREGAVVGLANHTILIARDGTERPIDDSAAPIRDDAGAVSGAVLVFRDIADRKEAEAAQARLAAIVASSEDAILSKTLDGVIRSWNAGAERLFGYTAAEAVGRPITLIIPPERLDEEAVIIGRLRRGERIDHFETVRVAKDGRRLDISLTVSPLLDEDGQVVGASKIARDITERKRIEGALRASEGLHRFLAELAAATQPLADPAEVMATTARLLARHLGADRCAYAHVEDESVFVIAGDDTRDVPSIVGRWPVASFGAECHRLMRANQAYVVDDATTDPRIVDDDRAAYRAATIQAVICVPLHKEGKFTAAMAVHQQTPRHWAAGEVALVRTVVGLCWEALERARVARTLRDSEARYRAMVDATPECVKLIGPDGILLQMNPAGLAMVEWDGREMPAGLCIYEIIAPEYRDAYRAFNERICRGESGTLAFEIVGLRGTRRSMETSAVPLPGPSGGFTHLAVTRDMSERVAAERGLRESEERYRRAAADAARAAEANAKFRAFFEQGTHFAAVLATDGAVVEANRLCLDACGFAREDVIGRPFWECGWWGRSEDLVETVQAAVRQAARGRMFRAESHYFLADGTERVVDLILAPVTDDAGHVLFVAASGSDVTDRRLMEDALREQDRRKNEFIALLGHELRNPLAPIRNGLQVMRLAGDDADAVAQARDMMDRQLGHMVRLIDDLLDVSRIGQNKMGLRRGPVYLADVVGSAVETARPAVEEAGHELAVALPDEPVLLDADLTRLAQVFSNLLTNSAKYTERGGRIWLDAGRQGPEVVVSVRDTGIGIPEDALPRIFDMFSQVDRSIERSTGGLGIGLALVKGLVDMHGGTVSAASGGPDRGSTFTVRLPVLESTSEPVPPPPTGDDPAPAAPPKRRILVVDDNHDSARSMARVLALMGNDVRTAHDGVAAVEAAEDFRPEVILMDVGMPRLNGYEATRQIREKGWGRSPIIIALTGWGQEGDRIQSREAGCDGHLVKPVNLPDLEELLAVLTGTGRHEPKR